MRNISVCLWETKGINRTSACVCLKVCSCELLKNNVSFRSKNKTLGKQHLSTPRRVARKHPRALLTAAIPPSCPAVVPDHPKRARSRAHVRRDGQRETLCTQGWDGGDALFKVFFRTPIFALFRRASIPGFLPLAWRRDRWLPCHVLFLLRLLLLLLLSSRARSVISLLFLGYNCDWLMWRRQFCCCCSVFFRSFSVVCVPRYVLIFPRGRPARAMPRPAHSSYVCMWVGVPLYQYGWENWFGGSSKTSRSPADWLGPPPKVESWERRPSTWDWYSAM